MKLLIDLPPTVYLIYTAYCNLSMCHVLFQDIQLIKNSKDTKVLNLKENTYRPQKIYSGVFKLNLASPAVKNIF